MRGLEPRIHDAIRRAETLRVPPLRFIMDCRVKPGNDEHRRCAGLPRRSAHPKAYSAAARFSPECAWVM
jgi:hypothetical protein